MTQFRDRCDHRLTALGRCFLGSLLPGLVFPGLLFLGWLFLGWLFLDLPLFRFDASLD